MHVNAKKLTLAGMMLAFTIICIYLGTVIETNTLFLLAAASYLVGIVYREMNGRMAAAFWIAAVLLGFFLSPNKFYVFSYAAMGGYILSTELAWSILERKESTKGKIWYLWCIKYSIFNLIFVSTILVFGDVLFAKAIEGWMLIAVIGAGQIGLYVYDRAYGYVQTVVWNKIRKILA